MYIRAVKYFISEFETSPMMAIKNHLISHSLFFILMLLGSFHAFSQQVNESNTQIRFYENKNQWPEHVLYGASVDAGNIWLEKGRILYHFMDFSNIRENHASHNDNLVENTVSQALVSATFLGSNQNAEIEEKNPAKGYQNYFKGSDPNNWATGVKGYSEVIYQSFYEGMDLVFFERNEILKYEFHLSPFSDPNQIKIKYDGFSKMEILENGSLKVSTNVGEIIENKPFVYQVINGEMIEIACEFRLEQDIVTFNLGDYNHELELIIDPELIFSTFAGSVSDSHGWTATYGYDGTAYVAGTIHGNNYPTPAPAWNTTPNLTTDTYTTSDIYISKYSADGSEMLWTNFMGGGDDFQGTETVQSIICDHENNIYLYGSTSSIDFPVLAGYQMTHAGGSPLSFAYAGLDFGSTGTDIYVSKLSADGMSLLGSTYIGGSGNDGVNYKISSGSYASAASYDSLTSNYSDQFKGEIMLDDANNILVVSSSWSADFPVLNGFQMDPGGMQDAVVFKISNDCSDLIWGTYYGGTNNDAGYSIKIDTNDNVFIAGGTCSDDLPQTIGGLQETSGGGKADGFVAKINQNGDVLYQSSYLGTNAYDQAYYLDINETNQIVVLGLTNGEISISPDKYGNIGSSIFIWELNNALTENVFSTLVGNGSNELTFLPTAFLVDHCGYICIAGWACDILPDGSPLTGMPTTIDAFQEFTTDGYDFYMLILDPDASDIHYGSYIGGNVSREHNDGGTSRFDPDGVLYQAVCAGCAGNSDFPTTPGVWSNINLSSECNSLIYKFDFEPFNNTTIAPLESDTICLGESSVEIIGIPADGIFSGSGIVGNEFFADLAGEGIHTLYYTVETESGCTGIDSLQITVVDCLGIPNLTENKITLFPNPFDQYTTINFGSELDGHLVIIYDILGQEVYRNESVTGSSFILTKQELGAGIYLLSIVDANLNELYTAKLVVE